MLCVAGKFGPIAFQLLEDVGHIGRWTGDLVAALLDGLEFPRELSEPLVEIRNLHCGGRPDGSVERFHQGRVFAVGQLDLGPQLLVCLKGRGSVSPNHGQHRRFELVLLGGPLPFAEPDLLPPRLDR
jgi:hypothetical protein